VCSMGSRYPSKWAILRKEEAIVSIGTSAVSCARTAELIDWPFGLWTRWAEGSTRSIDHGKAQWRHLANTIEPSVCGGDAVLCQITLTTCYAYTLHIFKCLFLLVLISQGLSGFHGCKFCILRFVSSLCRYGHIADRLYVYSSSFLR